MSESEIPEQVRRAYRNLRHYLQVGVVKWPADVNDVLDALRDERAHVLWYEHEVTIPWHNGPCEKCNREFAQWQAAAHKELTGE